MEPTLTAPDRHVNAVGASLPGGRAPTPPKRWPGPVRHGAIGEADIGLAEDQADGSIQIICCPHPADEVCWWGTPVNLCAEHAERLAAAGRVLRRPAGHPHRRAILPAATRLLSAWRQSRR